MSSKLIRMASVACGVVVCVAAAVTFAVKPFTLRVILPPHPGYEGYVDAVTQATNVEGVFTIRIDSLQNAADPLDSVTLVYGDGVKMRIFTGSGIRMAPDSILATHWYVRTDESKNVNICTTRVSAVTRSGVRVDTNIVVRVVVSAYKDGVRYVRPRVALRQNGSDKATFAVFPSPRVNGKGRTIGLTGKIYK